MRNMQAEGQQDILAQEYFLEMEEPFIFL